MVLVIIFVLLIILNFLLSLADIALGAFGENKINQLKDNNDTKAKLFEKFYANQDSVYGSLNFIYTAVLISISIIGYLIINDYLMKLILQYNWLYQLANIISLLLTSLFLTIIVLIFNVLIPKSIAFKYSDYIGRKSVMPILLLTKILSPLSKVVTFFANLILKPFKEKIAFSETKPFEDEILDIISDGVKSGTVDKTEQEIIENIFETTDLTVKQIMIPRTEMIALDILDDYDSNILKIIHTAHSVIPIYEKNADNILGMLHIKDLLKVALTQKKINLLEIMRPAFFVHENKPIIQTLKEMQKQGQRVAVVIDQFGGTEGIVTIEDILEEIIGEFNSDENQFYYVNKALDGSYYVLGTMKITDFNDTFNYKLPESDLYNTLAGFIAFKAGKILNPDEKIEVDDLIFELIKKIRQKMVLFRIHSKKFDFMEKSD